MTKPSATRTSQADIFRQRLRRAALAGLAVLLSLGATPISAHPTGATSTPPITPEILVANNCSRVVTVYPLGSNGDVAPLASVPAFSSPRAVAVDGQNNLYVLDGCTDTIEVFAPGSSGNAPPTAVIAGSNTGGSGSLAVDRSGDIYTVQSDSVALFASGANGNVNPTATINGPDTGLRGSQPMGIALDPSGKIYVSTQQGGSNGSRSANVYAASSTGDAKPIATISGPDTELPPPDGRLGIFDSLAADSQGKIYALLSGFEDPGEVVPDVPSKIAVYAAGSNGDAKPIHTITGSDTGLHTSYSGANAVAVTPSGIYVANFTWRSTRLQPFTSSASVEAFALDSDGDALPSTTISGPDTALAQPNSVALDTSGKIYVADSGYQGAIHVYAAGSSGDAAPTLTLGGPSIAPFYRSPVSAAVDGKGKLYVLSTGIPANAIDVYPAGSNGAGPPIATISGPHTGLQDGPNSIAVDSKGTIYIANEGRCRGCLDSVLAYRPGSRGDAKPLAVIAGSRTGLQLPSSIAVGPTGLVYVLNASYGTVTVYRPGSRGNVRPYATIAGANTGMIYVNNIAVDSCARVYVTQTDSINFSSQFVSIFAAHKFGNVAPAAVLQGPDTGLNSASQLAVDSSGAIYVGDPFDNEVLVYSPGSHDDASPAAIISGPLTGLAGPAGIAIAQPPPDPHSHPLCK